MKRQSEYWAKNVLSWEKGAYFRNTDHGGKYRILDRLSKYFRGDSIYKRSEAAYKLVEKFIKGQTICDVGCASGGFSRKLVSGGARYVYGFDVSRDAIDIAGQLATKEGINNKLEYSVLDVTTANTPLPECFLTISLGVIEYFDEHELQNFLANIKSQYYFISFIVKPTSEYGYVRKILRDLYLYFQSCPGIFYYTADQFQDFCKTAGLPGVAKLVHVPGGSFITNLAIDQQ